MSLDSDLQSLARLHGVQTSFVDMAGKAQSARREIVSAVLKALGAAAENEREIHESLNAARRHLCAQVLEPVIVGWDERPIQIKLHLPARFTGQLRFQARLENDETLEVRLIRSRIVNRIEVDGNAYDVRQITIDGLPFGYHEFTASVGGANHSALLISAPARAYEETPGDKEWGAFLPMYALRSRENWGAGNFTDWRRFGEWIGALGGSVAGTLPLLASFLDFPSCEPSPYAPASRLFWNPFYVDIPILPEFACCVAAQNRVGERRFQEQLCRLRENRLIDYGSAWLARREILELLSDWFFKNASPRRENFREFLRSRPEVEEYARFRATCDRQRVSWHRWDSRLRDGKLRPGDFDERDRRFHLYVQWLAQEQMDGLLASSRDAGVKLYLDLPLGVHPSGYDVWRHRQDFALQASAGAPPDMFFTKGQKWGFAPLHPQRIREDRYRHVIAFLRFQMRHTGLLRIDHVMGLHRLYWIPNHCPPDCGAYVQYREEELYAILILESHRHRTRLVGENLGTVPPEVNRDLKRHRLSEMFVVQYEQQPDSRRPLRRSEARSLACVNTHDMPPFAAHWSGLDLADRVNLGLIPKSKLAEELGNRRNLNSALIQFLERSGWLKRMRGRRVVTEEVLRALLGWLGGGSAEVVLVNAEDLWLEPLPQNVPGTSSERPNWRRKAALSLEEIRQHATARTTLGMLDASRRAKKKRHG